MAEALALLAQIGLGARLEPVRVLDESAQLVEALGAARRALSELLVAPPRRQQLAPGCAQLGTGSVVLRERVEHVELKRRPRKSALLELAGHRKHPLRGRGDVIACRGASPRVGASASVLEDAPREDEPRLTLGAELLELLILAVELGLDVRLLAAGPDHRRVAARAEQQ